MLAFRKGLPVALALLSGAACGTKSDPVPAPPPTAEVVSLPGIDTSALTPRERREWSAQMTELIAPCPEAPVNLATCVKEERACKACRPAAELMLKLVQNGVGKKERDEIYRNRFDAKAVKTIVTDGSPEKGPPDAPITIVEWADFECPACQATAPVLDALVDRFPGQVRLVYKQYPLKIHPNAEIAAKAAIAAGAQGKFWEMHHRLFHARGRLTQQDIEDHAKQLGLDIAKLRADLNSTATLERLEKDKNQAESLGLEGTPFIFINGREARELFHMDPEGYVKLDLELAGVTPKPAPPKASASAAASGAPSASASGSASAAPSASAAEPAPSSSAPPKK